MIYDSPQVPLLQLPPPDVPPVPNIGLYDPLQPTRNSELDPNTNKSKLEGVDPKLKVEPHSFIMFIEF